MHNKTLILGIGNIVRQDDGIGNHVINRLRDMNLPSNVELLDGGTAGFDLLPYLQGIDKLIVIDAILTGDKPGTIHIFTLDAEKRDTWMLNAPINHQTGIIETIETANLLYGKIDTTIIGIVPKNTGYGMELTTEVSYAVEKVIGIIKTLFGYDAQPEQKKLNAKV